jgi:hypothetical protein
MKEDNVGKAYQDEMARKRYRDDHWRRVETLLTEIRDRLPPFEEAIVITQGVMPDKMWAALKVRWFGIKEEAKRAEGDGDATGGE